MSDAWQVGDLALCVRTGASGKVRPGGVYTVESVFRSQEDVLSLLLVGHRSRFTSGGYAAFGFIKVTPPKADEFDTEVIEQMNRKPVEVS